MNHGDVGCVANVEIATPTAEHCFFPPSLPCLSRPRRVLNHDLVVSVLFSFLHYRGFHGLVSMF